MKSILYGEAKPSPKAEATGSNPVGCTIFIKGLANMTNEPNSIGHIEVTKYTSASSYRE